MDPNVLPQIGKNSYYLARLGHQGPPTYSATSFNPVPGFALTPKSFSSVYLPLGSYELDVNKMLTPVLPNKVVALDKVINVDVKNPSVSADLKIGAGADQRPNVDYRFSEPVFRVHELPAVLRDQGPPAKKAKVEQSVINKFGQGSKKPVKTAKAKKVVLGSGPKFA